MLGFHSHNMLANRITFYNAASTLLFLHNNIQYTPLMKMASGAVVSGMTSGEPANKE